MDGAGGTGSGSFERWLADVQVDEAARARARRHWIRTAAEEDATVTGVLLDLAERQVAVALTTTTGRRHHGVVTVVGDGFVALRTDDRHHVLVRLERVGTLRPAEAWVAPVGDRDHTSERTLLDVLVGLADDRATAVLVAGPEVVAGEVRSVGQDVVVLRPEAASATTVYVALSAVEEVALTGPPVQSLVGFESG